MAKPRSLYPQSKAKKYTWKTSSEKARASVLQPLPKTSTSFKPKPVASSVDLYLVRFWVAQRLSAAIRTPSTTAALAAEVHAARSDPRSQPVRGSSFIKPVSRLQSKVSILDWHSD